MVFTVLASRDKKLYNLKKLTQGSPEYLALKQNISVYNTILKKQIREDKIKHYYETFEKHKHDIKNTWKTISEILCKSSKINNPIKEIRTVNLLISNMSDICNRFNNFFVNIGPNLASAISPSSNVRYTSFLKKIVHSSFHFDLINEPEVLKVVSSLKNKDSAGYDGLSTKLLTF